MKVTKDVAHFKPITIVLESHAEAGAILRALKEHNNPNYHIEGLARLLDEELNGSCSIAQNGSSFGRAGDSGVVLG